MLVFSGFVKNTFVMTDDISEEHLSNGRTRRSAAVASSKAWHTLMPHKKGIFSDNEEGEIQEVERAEHSRKKRKQLAGADPPSAIGLLIR